LLLSNAFIYYLLPEGPYRTTIMEPLGKMNAYFPVVNEHITKRNKKVMLPAIDWRPWAIRLTGFSAPRLRRCT
jgi:hypothetical protein